MLNQKFSLTRNTMGHNSGLQPLSEVQHGRDNGSGDAAGLKFFGWGVVGTTHSHSTDGVISTVDTYNYYVFWVNTGITSYGSNVVDGTDI